MLRRRRAGRDGGRRQWGSDRRTPLPVVAPPAPDRTIAIGQLAVVVTVLGWAAFVWTMLAHTGGGASLDPQAVAYLVIMTLLAASALAYLITRLGSYDRTRAHRRAPWQPLYRIPGEPVTAG